MRKDSLSDWIEAITSKVGLGHNTRKIAEIRRLERKTGADFGGGFERIFQEELGYSKEEGNDYTASPDNYVKKMCKGRISADDIIIDLGCGKGYAMYLMGRYPFKKIYGIEKSDRLSGSAINNLQKIYGNTDRFGIWTIDATRLTDDEGIWSKLGTVNYVYIYNSFPGSVMKRVVEELNQKAREVSWKVTIWYAAPSKEPLIELLKSDCFELKKIEQVGNYQLVYAFDSIFVRDGEDNNL